MASYDSCAATNIEEETGEREPGVDRSAVHHLGDALGLIREAGVFDCTLVRLDRVQMEGGKGGYSLGRE